MGEAKRRQLAGPLGTFPDGVSKRSGDRGALAIAISDPDSEGNIHIDFGYEVSWIALPREQTIDLARTLLRKAGAKKVEITL